MSIGYNIENAVVKDKNKLLAHLSEVRPNWCLTYNPGFAKELMAVGVQNVTVRSYGPFGDGGVTNKLSPSDWMRRFQPIRDSGAWCEYTNESGLSVQNVLQVIPKALKEGFRITLPGIATGQPEPEEYNAYNEVLDYMTSYPDQLVYSSHDYFPGYPTILMGNINTVEQGRTWTPDAPVPEGALWLCGRTVYHLKQHQDKRGKPMPRMILTEVGEGNPGFLQGTPLQTPPYPFSFGYLSCANEWMKDWPNRGFAETYAQMLIWLDRMVYVPGGVEGICVYCYGADWNRPAASSQDWKPFDLELYADTFISAFERYAMSVDTSDWEVKRMVTVGGVNFRSGASLSAAKIGGLDSSTLPSGFYTVSYNKNGDITAGGYTWKNIRIGGLTGYVAGSFVQFFEDIIPTQPYVDTAAIQREVAAAQESLNRIQSLVS